MNARFLPEITAINQTIDKFNNYLSPAYRIPTFDLGRMMEDKTCIQIVHGNWNAFGFPHSEKRGVYFVFGLEKTNQSKNGVYVGKASFGSVIGRRLYAHLTHYRESDYFEMNGYRDEKYVLEYMAAVDLDAIKCGFLAAALEEFLITELKGSINLINGTGN
jgi:hypothetical protein